jgi:hypothetical protein
MSPTVPPAPLPEKRIAPTGRGGGALVFKQIGRLVVDLLADDGPLLMIAATADEFHVSVKAEQRLTGCRATLLEALAVAADREVKKNCRKCGKELPLSRYALDSNSSDGRLRRCKVCERARIAKWYATCGRTWKRGRGTRAGGRRAKLSRDGRTAGGSTTGNSSGTGGAGLAAADSSC